MQKNKTFCILPWVQTVIRTNGTINPCCQITDSSFNVTSHGIDEYYSSKELNDIKEKMLRGEKVSLCSLCYDSEEKVGRSLRVEANRDYKLLHDKHYAETLEYLGYNSLNYPSKVELHVGNACNLKCLTCTPRDSSAFLSEDRVLKISNYDQKNFNTNHLILNKIKNYLVAGHVKILDLRGGESMFEPKIKKFLISLDKNITKNINLKIQTNATILTDEWRGIISKFSSVDLMLSVDAYGDDNYYIRFPSNWNTIINNIDEFRTISNITNCFINTTVSNLNLLVLPKLFDWILKEELSCQLHTLEFPSIYQITNFPNKLIKKSINQLKKYIGKFKHSTTNYQLESLIKYLEKNEKELDKEEWENFCKMINKRDAYRKNSVFNVVPELKEFWINELET